MRDDKIKLAKEIFSLVNKDSITHKDLKEVIEVFLAKLKEVKDLSDKEYIALKADLKSSDSELFQYCEQLQRDLSKVEAKVSERDLAKIDAKIDKCIEDMSDMKDVIPEIAAFSAVTQKVDELSGDIKDITRVTTGNGLISTINTGTTKIERARVEGLDEELQKLIEKIDSKPSGGAVSNMRIQQAFKYILKTEQPSGAIDGVNTTYSVSQDIFAVLSFSLNGEVIAQLPNYTIAGKQIVFSTALPAAYSGKDFEIKYI
jgi:hypothetical protein